MASDGTWRAVLADLRVDCDLVDDGEWALGVDATVIRAHHHAADARHKPPKDIPPDVLAPVVLVDALRPLTVDTPELLQAFDIFGLTWN